MIESMSTTKAKTKLVLFDAARSLSDDAAIAEYMNAALETGGHGRAATCSQRRGAGGMSQVAKGAGLGRESLYNALTPGAKPRFDAVVKVARALGVQLTAQPTSA